ncbi:MAG: hypothetical protein DMF69_13435 [Acidobacteria bacterium]|nr:MAG: hypothetical protein DMF69_13435 [Acidobacteriota bacterium]
MSTTPAPPTIRHRLSQVTPVQWLIVAGIFHLVFTLLIFLIGYFRLWPSVFDQYGIGIGFALDGAVYRWWIPEISDLLWYRGFSAWYALQAPLHCRLYSLVFIFPGCLVGYNILAAEPLNLIYYLAILVFVYRLAKELFDSCTGLIAAGIVGVWPSLLIHTTQLVRDSLSIALMLALTWILVMVLQRKPSWRYGLKMGFAGVVIVIIFWLTRGNFWNIVIAELLLTLFLLIIRIVRERKLLATNFLVVVLVFGAVLIVPTLVESTTIAGTPPAIAVITIPNRNDSKSKTLLSRLVAQIRSRRAGFSVYGAQASNVDSNVKFYDAGDIARYLPRALAVGMFAPFPGMWFESGKSGLAGRLLAGAEMLVMYLLYGLALVCLWRERKRPPVWLLTLVAVTGFLALGLVVVNAGALFRLRYVFWVLVIVLASETIKRVCVNTTSQSVLPNQ